MHYSNSPSCWDLETLYIECFSSPGIIDDSNIHGIQFLLQNSHAFSYKELKVATNDFIPPVKLVKADLVLFIRED
ncbi:hypothetical protein M0R45_037076 [Rubus argutus]|uniref:Maturase K n=1 Tax=Rubus argutus TaxID=59490 RepID=A0AAW1W356_RUBAR